MLADGLGFAPVLGALGAAALVAAARGGCWRGAGPTRTRRRPRSSCAARWRSGVILASDVFETQAGVESLLFGSLLTIGTAGPRAGRGGAAAAAVVTTLVLGPAVAGDGLRPGHRAGAGRAAAVPDAVLLAVVALSAVGVLAAVGALLATALLVVPAATTRLVTSRLRAWQLWSVALAAAEGVGGLWLSYVTDAPPGRDDRRARRLPSSRSSPGGAAPGARTRVALARAAVARPGRRRLRGGAGDGRRPARRRDDDAARRRRARGRRRRRHVTQLLQPAADPHDYEPRPSDVRAVAEADLVLASGRGLDDWIDDVADDAGAGRPCCGSATRCRTRVRTDEGLDPHWWHDPRNMPPRRAAVGARLAPHVGRRPSAAVRRRAAAYARRAERLDAAIARCLAQVPRAQRKLVTDHDAFAPSPRATACEVVGAVIPSRSTQAQPSAGDVARLTRPRSAASACARCSPSARVDPRLARALAEQAGARVGGQLYADALGPRGSRGATVPARSEAANADAVVDGLTGGARRCRSRRHDARARRRAALGYGPRPVLDGRDLRGRAPASASACSGPTAAARRRSSAALTGELVPLAGRLDAAGRCAVVPQTERSRLDFPVSALDVALMGALAAAALVAAPRPAPSARRRWRRSTRVGLGGPADETFGDLSGGQRQRVLDRPRARAGRAGAAPRRAVHAASTRASARARRAPARRARRRGPRAC